MKKYLHDSDRRIDGILSPSDDLLDELGRLTQPMSGDVDANRLPEIVRAKQLLHLLQRPHGPKHRPASVLAGAEHGVLKFLRRTQ